MDTRQVPVANVSVIIPTFNNVGTIGRAIKSAQSQTLHNIEIVIVDDASTDGTYDLASSFAATDPRIKLTRLRKNVGAGGARNTALDMASGVWIAVLDADDWYEPNRLEVLLEAAQKNNVDVICDNLQIFDHIKDEVIEYTNNGLKNKVMPLSAERFFRYDDPLRCYPMGMMKPVVRKEFLQTHRIMYDANHRTGEDFIFLAEIILSGARALVVPGAYYVYVHRLSPTTRKISPHSRSGPNLNLIVRGCDEILQRYASSMTKEARFALERRRSMFQRSIVFQDMVAAIRERKLFKALEIVIKQPFILILVTATILKLIKANILYRR